MQIDIQLTLFEFSGNRDDERKEAYQVKLLLKFEKPK